MKEPRINRSGVEIELSKTVRIDTIHDLVSQIARLSGCTACGLVGIDVRFHGPEIEGPVPDPWVLSNLSLADFAGVSGGEISASSKIARPEG